MKRFTNTSGKTKPMEVSSGYVYVNRQSSAANAIRPTTAVAAWPTSVIPANDQKLLKCVKPGDIGRLILFTVAEAVTA